MLQRVRLGMITATGPSSRLAVSGSARRVRGIKSARSVPLQRGVGTTLTPRSPDPHHSRQLHRDHDRGGGQRDRRAGGLQPEPFGFHR
jgi:hypothetical protein